MTQQRSTFVTLLRTFDTATISDACEASGQPCRIVTGIAPLTGMKSIAGVAITVQLGPAAEVPEHSERHLCTTAVEAATADHIIVIDHQGRDDCAGWGGNLSRGAKARGCAGTIIDGAARDVDEAADLCYPVFATGATPRTARGRAVEVACRCPIQLAGATVNSGDFVIADSTGIVIVSPQAITEVLDTATTIARREEGIADRIEQGTPITEAMGRGYEQMLDDLLQ